MATTISKIIINAGLSQVWQALTQPPLIKQWQFGSDITTRWEVGGEIRFTTLWEGKKYEQWGKVLSFKPMESLEYTLFAPKPGWEDVPENYFNMTYTLKPHSEGTMVEIIQEDRRPGTTDENIQEEENPVLLSLKNVAESIAS